MVFNSLLSVILGGHMVLSTVEGRWVMLRLFIISFMVAGALSLGGCAGSEETMTEEEGFEEAAPAEETVEEPAKKEESGDQQALTSFLGAAPPKKEEQPKKEEPKTEPIVQETVQPPATGTNQMEELRTENTSLKQKIVKLEQDNRTFSARISDTETKYMTEKERADKAEEAARSSVSTRGKDMSETLPSGEAKTAYGVALRSFKSKQYDASISQLQGLLDGGTEPNLADNCHYWLGEANFGKRNYQEALKHFEMVFEYKNSEKLADAQYMMAHCYERLGDKAKAKEAYERVVKDYPTSNNVQRAKQRWVKM